MCGLFEECCQLKMELIWKSVEPQRFTDYAAKPSMHFANVSQFALPLHITVTMFLMHRVSIRFDSNFTATLPDVDAPNICAAV